MCWCESISWAKTLGEPCVPWKVPWDFQKTSYELKSKDWNMLKASKQAMMDENREYRSSRNIWSHHLWVSLLVAIYSMIQHRGIEGKRMDLCERGTYLAKKHQVTKEWIYDPRQGIMYLNLFDACLVCLNIFELFLFPILVAGISQDSWMIFCHSAREVDERL